MKRSDLAGHADYGYCASHSRFFWGFRLYLICTPEGMPIIWGLANPKIGERDVTQALLEHDHHLIRPDRKDEKKRFGKLAPIRQWIESVFDTLKRPARPRTTRRPDPGRRLRPRRRPTPGPRDRDLAQLAPRRNRQTITHSLRPLKPFGLTHPMRLRL